jgi:hypothetical protein
VLALKLTLVWLPQPSKHSTVRRIDMAQARFIGLPRLIHNKKWAKGPILCGFCFTSQF